MGFRIQGLGFRVSGLGFSVQRSGLRGLSQGFGAGFWDWGSEWASWFWIQDSVWIWNRVCGALGFEHEGSGCRVQDLEWKVVHGRGEEADWGFGWGGMGLDGAGYRGMGGSQVLCMIESLWSAPSISSQG